MTPVRDIVVALLNTLFVCRYDEARAPTLDNLMPTHPDVAPSPRSRRQPWRGCSYGASGPPVQGSLLATLTQLSRPVPRGEAFHSPSTTGVAFPRCPRCSTRSGPHVGALRQGAPSGAPDSPERGVPQVAFPGPAFPAAPLVFLKEAARDRRIPTCQTGLRFRSSLLDPLIRQASALRTQGFS